MVATVRAVEPAEFGRWLKDKRSQIDAADKLAATRRKQIQAEENQGTEAP